jgi:hypothetical protein
MGWFSIRRLILIDISDDRLQKHQLPKCKILLFPYEKLKITPKNESLDYIHGKQYKTNNWH